jgi:phosphatidylglycerol:prolipoprotein diacylglycerol transferase
MRRILFTCFGFNIYSYPAMLYLGLTIGIFVGAHIAGLAGLDPDRFAMAGVVLLAPGVIGARLLYVLMHWQVYAGDMRRIWRRSEGGMAMYGGLVMIAVLSIPLLPAMNLPFAAFWDAGIFTMLITMIFARVGCLLNSCCCGRPTDGWYGVNLPDHHGVWRRRFPTQLLEIAWSAVVLAALLAWRGRGPFPGALFCGGVAGYAAGRFFLQKLRDHHNGAQETGILQNISVILAIVAVLGGLLVWLHRSSVI